VSYSFVYKWHKCFHEGREELQDNKRCGRPIETCCNENIMRVKLKAELKGHKFTRFHDLQSRALSVLLLFDTSFNKNILSQWVHRHERCVEVGAAFF
jgi:hypothetical protein